MLKFLVDAEIQYHGIKFFSNPLQKSVLRYLKRYKFKRGAKALEINQATCLEVLPILKSNNIPPRIK